MESTRQRPDREHFSLLLQSVFSSRPRTNDFKNMEDVQDLASSSTESASCHNTTLSSTSHSLESPLLPSSSSLTTSSPISPIPKILPKSKQPKHSRSNRSLSIDYGAPSDVTNQVIPWSKFPTRSKSFDGNLSRLVNIVSHGQKRHGHGIDEALSSRQAAAFIDVSHYSSLLSNPSTPRRSIRHSCREKSQQQRKSIDLGYNMMQTSLRRLRRSPSLWTTGGKSSSINDARDRHIHNLRAEPQLSDQQKLVALKRARKIAQVFGSEAPIDVVHGNEHIHRHSAIRRDSLSTIVSGDVPPSIVPTRRRSNSDSSLLVETTQSSSISLDLSETPSYLAPEREESPSLFPSSSFSERRRRAAKLTHFFGVNYQDISIAQRLLPPIPQQIYSGTNDDISDPGVEVDVKVVGRRFWGRSDGEMKTADVADVISKLRGLRAG